MTLKTEPLYAKGLITTDGTVVGADEIEANLPAPPPTAGQTQVMTLSTARSSGTWAFTVNSSSSYYRVLWPDGSNSLQNTGTTTGYNLANGSGEARVWPCAVTGNELSGQLTSFNSNNQSLSAIDISYLPNLASFILSNDSTLTSITGSDLVGVTSTLTLTTNTALTAIDFPLATASATTLTGNSAVTAVDISSTTDVSIGFSGSPLIASLALNNSVVQTLSILGSSITSFDASAMSVLTTLTLNSCSALTSYTHKTTGLSFFNFTNNDAFTGTLNLSSSAISTLVVTGNAALTSVNIDSCGALGGCQITSNGALTSISASGAALFAGGQTQYQNYRSYPYYDYTTTTQTTIGTYITNNNLSGAALDSFYTDLASTIYYYSVHSPSKIDLGVIDISGNPGVGSDTPTIATAKGYAIIGT